jgi:molecular chaperone DnaK
MIHSVNKTLKEHGDKLEGDEKSKIEAALKEAEEALKSDSKDAIDAKTQALAEASQKLTEKMYAQEQAKQQAQPGTETPPSGNGSNKNQEEGEVVDAEFEEVKDKNK